MIIIKIGNKEVSSQSSVFIVAELSANHNQDFDLAIKTIKSMKKAGADAVKIQTYTPDTITIKSDKEYFQIQQGTIWDGQTLYDLYKKAYTPWEWHPDLQKVAEDEGLLFFSSPFDRTAVDLLEELDVPAYKIASFEITDIPLIEYIASKGKPVIISTGISTLSDIEEAVNACRRVGNDQIVLLKCTSSYPAPFEEINLKTIPNLAEVFDVVVGLSDHSMGSTVAIASVALGAKVVEKHFILDRNLGGPDSAFSMEPDEFNYMVKSIRNVEKALGTINYSLSDKAKRNREFARSLFVVEDIKKGESFTLKNVKSIRPGYGLHPKYLKNVLGKKTTRDIERGTPLKWELVE
ncbi:MAG: pseudaminic acid synthase [Promethearchaeota archaeon]